MVTYIQKDLTSDLNPITKDNTALFDDIDMSNGLGVDADRAGTVPSLGFRSYAGITLSGFPNNDAWESGGTQTMEMEIIAGGGMNLRARVRIGRVNSSGTVLQTGNYTGFQSMQASRVFSPVAPTWTGGQEDCGNRYFFEVELENIDTMMDIAITMGLGTVANEMITDITENSSGCVGGVVTHSQAIIIGSFIFSLFISSMWRFFDGIL